jgi:hypothetical protein
MPKASAAAKVVLLSAYEADAVSTATIGSQDVATRTGRIEVEAGSEPLYVVVVSFRPVIWRFSGAVERLERVVHAGTNTGPNRSEREQVPLVGAIGVPAARVTMLPRAGCLQYFTEAPSTGAAVAAAHVRQDAGKEIAATAARYQVSGFDIPSGAVLTSERGRGQRPTLVIRKPSGSLGAEGGTNIVVEAGGLNGLRGDVARFYPGGVVEVDPVDVVSSRPAARYEVLPNQAGLLQLVQSGALTRNHGGEYLIHRKIHFPAELYGAHAVKFLLLRGVPEPDGDPGHSCVIVEETGRPLKVMPTCR